jgi:hypothetical protein
VASPPNTILFHFQFAARLDSSSDGSAIQPGDIITDTTGDTPFDFGDGTTGVNPVQFRVLSLNTVGGYFVAEAVHDVGGGTFAEGLIHTYAAPGDYTAFSESGDRISTLRNDADGLYRTETIVNVGSGNRPPVSSLPPIVQVADNTTATFQVPAADPNGDALNYRLATSTEASGGSGYTQPPGLTISPSGLVTWDIHDNVVSTNPGDLWTAQVEVEDLDTTGHVKSKIALDFILQVVTSVSAPPEFDIVPNAPIDVQPAQSMSFVVQASDSDLTKTVSVQALNPPTGMTFTTEPPSAGSRSNAAAIRADFTPTAAQAAQTFVITFQVTNNLGLSSQASVTLRPGPTGHDSPPVFDVQPATPLSVVAGQTVRFDIQASDPDSTDKVKLSSTNLPTGAVLANATPAPGSRANATAKSFELTTDSNAAGQTITLNFVADDGRGMQATTTVTLNIVASIPTPPDKDPSPPPGDIGPTVTSLVRYGYHMMPTTLVLTFDRALDPSTAQNVKNYRLVDHGGRLLAIRSAVYDAAARTVTLRPMKRLSLHHRYRLTIDGTSSTGVRDMSGRLMDGARIGRPGSDYTTMVLGKRLAIPNPIPKSFFSWLPPHRRRQRAIENGSLDRVTDGNSDVGFVR